MQWRAAIPKNAPHRAPRHKSCGGRLRSAVRVGIAALAAAVLAGCSKTASWEEEVPLNTGATIWVKRSVKYTLQGGSGNPMNIAYRPVNDTSISFVWNDKEYQYYGDACIQLLAIDPHNAQFSSQAPGVAAGIGNITITSVLGTCSWSQMKADQIGHGPRI